MTEFSYESWDRLLAVIVDPDGKVDYECLMESRTLLKDFVAQMGEKSPDSHPDLFPTHEDGLAYWINAYNAFTLAAIADEYPIRSVWKTREGQFFQRQRHVVGGQSLSLDDIEHTILRGDFAEPRIHFAINCGSNGCPPVRPEAYRGDDLHQTLDRATASFLSSDWNCRVDHAKARIYISRIFKMYAQDFAGHEGTHEDYRVGVLEFVAQHSGLDLDTIRDYEVVYNVYDWGLNDSHREPNIGPIVFHEPVEHFNEADRELRELHLYEGNLCNRDCSWCTINGSTEGWYKPYSPVVLDQALETLAEDGNLKFYGGEPTLHASETVEAMRYTREHGFCGLITVFSNGIQARNLIRILESDPHSEAVLNYSIYHGRDADPLPSRAKSRLEEWAREHPNRMFLGYKVLFHAGAGADQNFDLDREAEYHGMGTGCVRCFPVLTTAGRFHACPFAAEIDSPHFDLGRIGTEPDTVYQNYRSFLQWVDDVLDPSARERGISSCEMCHRHLEDLPPAKGLLVPERTGR